MSKKLLVREALVLLATGVAFCALAMLLPLLFGIELWPVLTRMPFAPVVILSYVLMRWRVCQRRCRS